MKLSKIILLSEEKNIYKLIYKIRCEFKIPEIKPIFTILMMIFMK